MRDAICDAYARFDKECMNLASTWTWASKYARRFDFCENLLCGQGNPRLFRMFRHGYRLLAQQDVQRPGVGRPGGQNGKRP